jgi:hypothetical protein
LHDDFLRSATGAGVEAEECGRYIADHVFAVQHWGCAMAGVWVADWFAAIIAANLVTLVLAVAILALKLRYRVRDLESEPVRVQSAVSGRIEL